MNIFNLLIEQPLINLLVAIYNLLVSFNIPHAFGFSIVALSAGIRILIAPFIAAQYKASKKMQDMAPHMAKIKEQHKGDIRKQNEAQALLMKEHGVNPLAGCLPALLQFPIIIGLFIVLQNIAKIKNVNEINNKLYSEGMKLKELWNTNFFGIDINKTPQELLSTAGVGILLIVIITAFLQLVQSLMSTTPQIKPQETKDKEKQKAPDFSSTMQKQMLFFIPILLGYSSLVFPIGLSIYWNTFSIFGIIQQYRISGWGGLGKYIKRK